MKLLQDSPVSMLDPSLLLRPEKIYDGKPVDAFRDYSFDENDPIKERVRRTYYEMHSKMTVDFVKGSILILFYDYKKVTVSSDIFFT